MGINWDRIKNSKDKQERLANAHKELLAQDYICLSDIFVNFDRGGSQVKEALDNLNKDRPMTYRILVMRGVWGEQYKPGDVFEWKRSVLTRENGDYGKKLTAPQIEAKLRRGEGHKKYGFAKVGSAIIDEYGCIEVPYHDAAMLLSNHGQHFETGYGITGQREVSSRPHYVEGNPDPWDTRKILGKGAMRYRWGWLYKEVPPGTDLPKWTPPEPDAAPVKEETLEELEARVAKLKSEAKEQKRIAKLKEEAAMLELKEQ